MSPLADGQVVPSLPLLCLLPAANSLYFLTILLFVAEGGVSEKLVDLILSAGLEILLNSVRVVLGTVQEHAGDVVDDQQAPVQP